jgi:glycosyltransferase involved in cell wall biosynthesis
MFVPWTKRLKIRLGAMRRGQKPVWVYQRATDIEYQHSLDADQVSAPCKAIGELLGQAWSIPRDKLAHVPYPFVPSPELLKISAAKRNRVVLFMGRLEFRKGVIDLARAIPAVLARHPDVIFRFLGSPKESPLPGKNMKEYLQMLLAGHEKSVQFPAAVAPNEIPGMLADSDICVFPSIWENFPNVCFESMSAGRATVGSSAGGMAEQLDGGKAGRLIRPRNPSSIANTINALLDDEKLRIHLGEVARQRVLDQYNVDRIGALQEASYERAIQRHASK